MTLMKALSVTLRASECAGRISSYYGVSYTCVMVGSNKRKYSRITIQYSPYNVSLLHQCYLGVYVPEFQSDGIFNEQDYIRYNQNWTEPLSTFTICTRSMMYFLRGAKQHFFSYANTQSDDALNGAIKVDPKDNSFKLIICKFRPLECVKHELGEDFFFNQWMHMCAVFTATNSSNPDVFDSKIELYINGSRIAETTQTLDKDQFKTVEGGGVLIIGQEQDSIGGYFDDTQSWSGSVTQLEIWSKAISLDDIQKLASCEIETLDIPERIVQWTENQWTAFGNVSLKQESLGTFCQTPPRLNSVLQFLSYIIHTYSI